MSNENAQTYFEKSQVDPFVSPSRFLFQAEAGGLVPSQPDRDMFHLDFRAKRVEKEIATKLRKKNYPCIGAVRSFHRNEYQVGLYSKFGDAFNSAEFRNDLLYFLAKQKEMQSSYLSFWAVFDNARPFSETEFESRLWHELSRLTSEELKKTDWPAGAVSNPNSKSFSFCIGGSELFVVGLHSLSSRLSRRFPWPALVFNSFDQFNLLKEKGHFNEMVKINRSLDNKFQGSTNPMAIQWGEIWESIQFSGKDNPSSWKCPFNLTKKIFS